MNTIYEYLSEPEARAEAAYRRAYCTEYTRVYEPGCSQDRERLLYWSALAHSVARAARDRVLRAELAQKVRSEEWPFVWGPF